MSLKRGNLERVLRQTLPVIIEPDQIETFEKGKSLDLYLTAIGTKPRLTLEEKREYGSMLVRQLIRRKSLERSLLTASSEFFLTNQERVEMHHSIARFPYLEGGIVPDSHEFLTAIRVDAFRALPPRLTAALLDFRRCNHLSQQYSSHYPIPTSCFIVRQNAA